MATAPLNIDTKRLPTTPQWSPILSHSSLSSPRSSSTSTPDDLSSRCRKLARSFGEHSILDDPHFEPQSPSRSRENSQENSSSSPLPPPPPASPLGRHSHHLPLSPPTPEGSHVLNEILEEENESMTGTPIRDEEEEEKGLGFEKGAGEAMQFKMSPCLGGQMSLHGAGIALEEQARGGGGGAGLGLSLHDQMKMDNEEIGGDYVDHDRALQEELKNGKDWIKLDVSLVDDELLIGSPQSQLDPSRTFSTCYVDPLLRLLTSSTPSSPSPLFSPHLRRFSSSSSLPSPTLASPTSQLPSGLPSSSRPLHLHLTLHTPLQITLQYLLASLQPLHDQHHLVSYCSNARLTSKAPVMILVEAGEGEGEEVDRELEKLGNPRIIYREARIEEFGNGKLNDQSHPIVAIDYKRDLASRKEGGSGEVIEKLHEKGFSIKVEGIPRFPEHERKSIELHLKDSKVDYIV